VTDIWIAGLGVKTVSHVTKEVEEALRQSREVLYLDTGAGTRKYIESVCPRVTSLFEESYREDRPRVSAYEHIAIRVVEAALDHPPVTFAIHGHPLVAATPPFLILQLAHALDLRVEVLPGISSLDTLFADLRLDPVVHGIQMYEASDVLLRRRPLFNDVPAIVWQIGPLETALHSDRASQPERFERFVQHLRRYYPAGHEVTAIYCSPHPLMPPNLIRFAIEDMGRHAEQIHGGFTLYIPPSAGRPVVDGQFAAQLFDPEHLKKITR
jgi:precorrin-3B methylase